MLLTSSRATSARYSPLSQIFTGGMRRPFAVVLLGGDVERSGNRAADVGPVPVRLHQGDEAPLVEDRPDDADIAEVGATQIGIVDGDDVTRVEVVLEGVEHGLR